MDITRVAIQFYLYFYAQLKFILIIVRTRSFNLTYDFSHFGIYEGSLISLAKKQVKYIFLEKINFNF